MYLVESLSAPVVKNNPHLSDVLVIRHRRGWARIREDAALARKLWRAGVDVAIDFHGGPRSGWLTWATRAPMRVGYDVSGRQWMYTHLVARPRGYAPRHSVRNQWDLLGPVDPAFQNPPDPARDRLEMPVTEESQRRTSGRLASLGIQGTDRIVVMHASAGNQFRRWPAASFSDVAARLVTDRRWVIVLGSDADEATVHNIVSAARMAAGANAERIVGAAGWPLDDVRALMGRATLFVGGDSGPMHIAATTDIPIVAVFGPTLPVHWSPWRPATLPFSPIEPQPLACRPCDQRVCAPGDFRCLMHTSSNSVVMAAQRLLEASA